MPENRSSAIVLTAQLFNPSIFTERWLLENGLLPNGNMVGTRIFSEEIVQFQTKDMHVLVTPPKVQVSFPILNEDSSGAALSFVSKIIDILPHTPFKALGINFEYLIPSPEGQDFGSFDKAMFGSGKSPILAEFDSPDARFGGYFSKSFGSARLKLDIKPIIILDEGIELLQFSFNFHHGSTKENAVNLLDLLKTWLSTWEQLKRYSEHVVDLANGRPLQKPINP